MRTLKRVKLGVTFTYGTGEMVAIMAEGKQHCMAIGQAKMSRDQMYVFLCYKITFISRREVNKGHGLEVLHYLNDGLWETREV